MANNNPFSLFITNVDSFGPFLKLWGQSDQTSIVFIERFLLQLTPEFEKGHYVPNVSSLKVGQLCVGKWHQDEAYYRAKILDLTQIRNGQIVVHFIDHGNTESLPFTSIRVVDGPSPLTSFLPLANEYILAEVVNAAQVWNTTALQSVTGMICNMDVTAMTITNVAHYKVVRIQYNNGDLTKHLIECNMAIPCSLNTQIQIITQKINQPVNFSQPIMQPISPLGRTQVSPIMTQISPRNDMKQFGIPRRLSIPSPQPGDSPTVFKNTILPIHSEHMVTITAVDDGPKSFTIQLQPWEKHLNKIMMDLNTMQTESLKEIPVPGTLCVARSSSNRALCRAVITQVIEDNCKVYFVDFGNSEIIPYSDLYQLSLNFICHKILALRFSLANLKSINLTSDIKNSFKDFVIGKKFKLRVSPPEGPPVLQYGELFDEKGMNVLTILKATLGLEVLKFRPMGPQETDCIADILVAFVKNCQEFYVHFLSDIDALENLMSDIALHCTSTQNCLTPNRVQVGMACCALFPDDEQWYRAEILSSSGPEFKVKYIDYGNESYVHINQLKDIPVELINRLPMQAIRCCLSGYENLPISQDISTIFENLALEMKFTMKIIKYHTPQVLLVDLLDPITRQPITVTLQMPPPAPVEPVQIAEPVVTKTVEEESQFKKPKWNKIQAETPPSFDENENASDNNRTTYNQNRSPRRNKERSPRRNKERSPRSNFSPRDRFSKNQDINKNDNWNEKASNSRFSRNNSSSSWNTSPKSDNWNKDASFEKPSFKSKRHDSKKGESSWKTSPKQSSSSWNEKSWNTDKEENSWNSTKGNFDKKRNDFRSNGDRGNRNFNKDSKFKRSGSNMSDGYSSDRSKTSEKSDRSFKKKPQQFNTPPPDYAEIGQKYTELDLPDGAIEDVMISWFYNPKNFYVQILSSEKEFKKMMTTIQKVYKKREPVQNIIPVGSSVIAQFSEDGYLYRATVLDVRLTKYKIRYVDYGNTHYVEKSKIWNIEKQFMTLPTQAVVCTLPDIFPAGEVWNDSLEMDSCFNKGSYQCVFQGTEDNKRVVSLSYQGLLVVDELLNKGLATKEATVSVTGVAYDPSTEFSLTQQIPGIEHDIEDAPIDYDLLPKQIIRVFVCCAHGLERFFVYLDKAKAQNVLSEINNFLKDSNSPLEHLPSDQLIRGTVCITETPTGWQRCIILDANSTSGVYVEFPDVGGGEEISANKLFCLPMELTGFYYQSLECSLFDFSLGCSQNITDEKFQAQFENTEVIIYIHEIKSGKLMVTLYDLEGKKYDLIKNDEENKDYHVINRICPMPILNGNVKVWVSHINAVNSLYIQRSSDSSKLEDLTKRLFQYYEFNPSEIKVDIVTNSTYAVKSADGNWYRGTVVEINDENVTVIYIDYGNQETIPSTSVRMLDTSFEKIYELALHVALPVTSNGNDILQQLRELTDGKEFYSKLAYTEGCWYIELYNENAALSQYLIDSGLANKLDFDPLRRRTDTGVDELQPEEEEGKIMLYIAHADSPNQFYAQLASDEQSINALQEELHNSLNDLIKLEKPDIGVLCAAKYSADNIWYRAEVLDADDQITTVRFIDFGNTDVLDNSSDVIKTLPAHMLTIDRYAKQCSLDLLPVNDEWSQAACELFEEKVVNQVCQACILHQDDKGVTYLNLHLENENLAQLLINEGFGKPLTRDLDEEISSKTGFVSHINSINEFWIQLESSCTDLEMVSDQLSIADNFPDLTDKRPGILCAAKFTDDMWYRARILTIAEDEIQVLFIDYGNSSPTTELKMLPEQVINLRALALKCTLQKPSTIEDWPCESTEKFKEIAADGATVFEVKVITTGETSEVELFVDDKNILTEILPNLEPPINSQKAIISNFDSPSSFWIQLESETEILNDIINNLENFNGVPISGKPSKDKIYICKLLEDELWYRAKILSEDNEGYTAYFIDYGNSCLVTECYECNSELNKIKPLAQHCRLKLPENTSNWNELACSKFENIVTNSDAIFDVNFISTEEKPFLVDLSLDNVDITSQLTKLLNNQLSVCNQEIRSVSPIQEVVENVDDIHEIQESIENLEIKENCEKQMTRNIEHTDEISESLETIKIEENVNNNNKSIEDAANETENIEATIEKNIKTSQKIKIESAENPEIFQETENIPENENVIDNIQENEKSKNFENEIENIQENEESQNVENETKILDTERKNEKIENIQDSVTEQNELLEDAPEIVSKENDIISSDDLSKDEIEATKTITKLDIVENNPDTNLNTKVKESKEKNITSIEIKEEKGCEKNHLNGETSSN